MKFLTKAGVVIVCLLVLTGNLFAQEKNSKNNFKPFTFGVKGGLNYSTITGFEMSNDDIEFNGLDYRAGYHIGLMWQYLFTKNMGIESGLYYSQLGGVNEEKFSSREYQAKYKVELTPTYLQMPVLFIYKFRFTQDLALYPSGGLYFGYGIGGSYEEEVTLNGQTESDKGDFFSSDNELNRFDMGISMGVNLEYRKILFGLGVDAGFLKINKISEVDNNDIRIFNNNLKLSVGYLF